MDPTIRTFDRHSGHIDWPARDIRREWLVTNGLGGYASGTLDGLFSRRYHGLLIAALPTGRTMMLNGLTERIRLPDRSVWHLGAEVLSGVETEKTLLASEFRLEQGLPTWRYEVAGFVLEKSAVMTYRQNTTHVRYRLLEGNGAIRLGARPTVDFRPHDDPVNTPVRSDYRVILENRGCVVAAGTDDFPLRLVFRGTDAAFTFDKKIIHEILYPLEEERGYEFSGPAWSPGYFRTDIAPGQEASLIASVEEWDVMLAVNTQQAWEIEQRRRQGLVEKAPEAAQQGFGRELILAADQFLVRPASRNRESALAHAEGEEAWTIMAGYHWFTDWGRDTMISLEGLALSTGRFREARWILRTFARHIRDGLIPNFFLEGAEQGLYHTADATMWFFHALHRYLIASGERETLSMLLPKLLDIVDHHLQGTRYHICVDPKDGLLTQGESGYQLTWMDAKVGDWVVTPRRGKTVEINALWYNALRLTEQWLRSEGHPRAHEIGGHAARVQDSFTRRFWSDKLRYLYDVVDGPDGDDPACRPNQIFSISLDHPVLDPQYWAAVVQTVQEKLVTPVGLRSLSRDHSDYKPVYFGDLRSRDAAYHQGTVWAWLIGPFIDAYLKVHPGKVPEARAFLAAFCDHAGEASVGSISEIFDGDPPFTPRGCIAQAWSVAEVLRCWVLTGAPPAHEP